MCQIDYLLTEDKEKNPQNACCYSSLEEYLLVFCMAENSDAYLIEEVSLPYSKLKQLQSVVKARIEKEQAGKYSGIFTSMMKLPLRVVGKTG